MKAKKHRLIHLFIILRPKQIQFYWKNIFNFLSSQLYLGACKLGEVLVLAKCQTGKFENIFQSIHQRIHLTIGD